MPSCPAAALHKNRNTVSQSDSGHGWGRRWLSYLFIYWYLSDKLWVIKYPTSVWEHHRVMSLEENQGLQKQQTLTSEMRRLVGVDAERCPPPTCSRRWLEEQSSFSRAEDRSMYCWQDTKTHSSWLEDWIDGVKKMEKEGRVMNIYGARSWQSHFDISNCES